MKRNKESLQELWDTIKETNKCVIGGPEGEERKKAAGSLFKEIKAENFPNQGRHLDIQVHEANRSSNNCNSKLMFSKTHYNKTV